MLISQMWNVPNFYYFKPNMTYVYISDVECPKCRGNIFSYGNFTKQTKVLPLIAIILQIWRDTGRVLCFHQYLYQLIDLG